MINKYLKELVENNNRIIIPDFGAFMVQNTPEGKQISFNDFLKFNDGLLINQIIKSEKISKNDAADQVKEFVKSIESAFNKGESFEVKGLGYLAKDNNGNIKFDKELSSTKTATPKTDAKATIVLDEKKEAAKSATKKVEPKKEVTAKAPVAKPESKPVTPPVAEKKPAAATPPAAAPVTPPKPAASQGVTNTTTAAKSVSNTNAETISKPTKPTSSNSSGSTKVVLIIVAALIILGGGGYALWYFGVFSKSEPVVEVAPVPEPVIDTLPAVDTTAKVDTVIEEPMVVEEPAIDPNAKHYYIIAGSFKVPTNADNYMQKLIDEGYKSEIIERSNGFHTVSYETLYDWNEALSAWKKMREVNEQTWILIK